MSMKNKKIDNEEIIKSLTAIDIQVLTNKGEKIISLYDFVNMKEQNITFITDDTKEPRIEFNLNIKFDGCKMKIK